MWVFFIFVFILNIVNFLKWLLLPFYKNEFWDAKNQLI